MQRCGGQRGCEHKLNTEISHSSGGFRLETLGYVFDVPFFVQCSPGQTLILSYSKTMVFAVFSPAPGSWVRPLNVSSAAMIVCAELSPGVFELQSSPPAEGGDVDSTTVLSRNGRARIESGCVGNTGQASHTDVVCNLSWPGFLVRLRRFQLEQCPGPPGFHSNVAPTQCS